jgi:hypothetical protein
MLRTSDKFSRLLLPLSPLQGEKKASRSFLMRIRRFLVHKRKGGNGCYCSLLF